MKYNLFILLIFVILQSGYSQANFNIEVVSNVGIDERGNDVWGFVAEDGTEYAIMGSLTKTSIWSLADPENPEFITSFDGPSSIWRDIKSYEDHIYIAADRGLEGLLVLDMSEAPNTISATNYRPIISLGGSSDTLHTIHNIYIDEDEGFCYLAGSNISEGGVLIFDLKSDKKSPEFVGAEDFDYAHDVFVRDDLMYTSDINSGVFSIYNIEDKTTPIFLGNQQTAKNFSHNAWLSDDGNTLFTTDERPDAFVEAYDVSDPLDITFLDRYQPFETQNTGLIPHNVHYHKSFLVTSWNTDGLVIVDAHDPMNLVKIAAYDTELEITSGSGGLWGAYPYLPSGLVLGSDRNHGLFVFRILDNNGEEGYQRASYIEGTVTVKVISSENVEASTNAAGYYSSGHALEGEYEIEFKKDNYDDVHIIATFESGQVVELNVEMISSLNTVNIIDLGLSMSPNPSRNMLFISVDEIPRDTRFKIFAQNGNEVYNSLITKMDYSIDISHLSNGIYNIRLETKNGFSKTHSFIKN